jgi:hypothetical protein
MIRYWGSQNKNEGETYMDNKEWNDELYNKIVEISDKIREEKKEQFIVYNYCKEVDAVVKRSIFNMGVCNDPECTNCRNIEEML